ncbi:MAG: UDP-N-acetylglucosamine 2-epimerase (non-hydrolyzing) [Chloroflexi bacterium]|nr:UDP-N-acetylglucosamine 2-epimerase (non-hydrolyzing) [Chloroflexota bacterium]MBP8059392.1 UDP-N-acetylglucosamine 2-epimerase (non-hydrolyzing) [Chloroflexota bacterium]
MKILSIVGARPEFIQGSPVSRALRPRHQEILVHTGQHYDYKMSQAFFDELEIPAPDYNLEVGSGQHGQQTGQILARLEEVLLKEQPDLVIIRGDTNSTLAGAIAASKLHIPLAHIEAGERSFDRRMPEEINRVVADSISNMHFCVSQAAIHNLAQEGIRECVHWVGDVMYDAMLFNRPIAYRNSNMVETLELERGRYALVTVHRAANTDDPARLSQIVNILNNAPEPVIFPAHPRTRKALTHLGAAFANHVRVIDPVSYFDMIVLEDNARLIATDSGGVQREAYFLSKPCLTLRDETEWTETVKSGWNQLMPLDLETVMTAWQTFTPPAEQPPIFGDGKAGEKIARLIEEIMG